MCTPENELANKCAGALSLTDHSTDKLKTKGPILQDD